MNNYLSDKLKVLSFLCIVFVVWIHMYYTEGEQYVSTRFLMNIIGGGICCVAVPLFYSISGYLFFLNTRDKGLHEIFIKQRKRVRTLLIPYILTNILSMLFFYVLKIISTKVSVLHTVINNNLLDRAGSDIIGVLYYCFWDGPIAFQMWFVRDLMVFVLFAPIIYYLLYLLSLHTILTILGLISGIILVFLHHDPFSWSFGWFVMGGLLSMSDKVSIIGIHSMSTLRFLKKLQLLLVSVVGIIIIINALYVVKVLDFHIDTDFVTILGVPALWLTYDRFSEGKVYCKGKKVSLVCSKTFFIYLIHEPFLNIFKKVPLVLSKSELCINFSYLLVPLFFIYVTIKVASFLKSKVPPIYNLFTGGR